MQFYTSHEEVQIQVCSRLDLRAMAGQHWELSLMGNYYCPGEQYGHVPLVNIHMLVVYRFVISCNIKLLDPFFIHIFPSIIVCTVHFVNFGDQFFNPAS